MTDLAQWTDEQRLAAAAIHGGVLLGFAGFVPVAVWAMYKDKHPELAAMAYKAILVQFVTMAVVIGISLVTCGFGAVLIFPWFAYEVFLAVKAFQGEYVGYPV
jgi:uncharacterized Tic20 family protein